MKERAGQGFLVAGCLCLWLSCSNGSETSEDGTEDRIGDESVPDGHPDQAMDGTVDGPTDDPSTVDAESEDAGFHQGPVDFIVRNTSSAVTYLDWSHAGNTVIEGARATGADWESFYYLEPSSCRLLNCEGVDPDSPGACVVPPCGIMFAVRQLDPGQEVVVPWNGERIFTEDADYCEQGCYWPADVGPMQFRVTVCTYDTFACVFDPPCGPSEDGIFEVAQVEEGTEQCFETAFTVPYAGSEVVIEVE